MSFLLPPTNYERKNLNNELKCEANMAAAATTIKDEKLVENLRNLVKEFLEIVCILI